MTAESTKQFTALSEKKFGPGPARPTLDPTVHSNPENVRILD